jgi:hypothetical protein
MANGDLLKLQASIPGEQEASDLALAEALSGIASGFQAQDPVSAILKGITGGVATTKKLSAEEQKSIRLQKLQQDITNMQQVQTQLQNQKRLAETLTKNKETLSNFMANVLVLPADQRGQALRQGIGTISGLTDALSTVTGRQVNPEDISLGENNEIFLKSDGQAVSLGRAENYLIPTDAGRIQEQQARKEFRVLNPETGLEETAFGTFEEVQNQGKQVLGLAPSRQQITQVQQVPTPTEATVSGEIQAAFGETLSQARQIPTQEFNLDRIVQGIRGGANTGPAAGVMTFINSLGAQAGLDINLGGGSSLEQVRSAANELIIPKVKALGSRPSDKDLQFVTDAAANAGKSVEANLEYIDAQRQLNSRLASHAAIIRDNAAQSGVSIDNLLRDFDAANPFTARSGADVAAELGIDLEAFDVTEDIKGAVPTAAPAEDIEAAKKRLGIR